MITNIRLQNLKALKDTGYLKIRPLTFLIGPNSSGKSTLLQALLMIKQTVDSTDMRNPLLTNGPWVEMGSYRDLIHDNNVENTLKIDITAGAPDYIESLVTRVLPTHMIGGTSFDSQYLPRQLFTHVEFNETTSGRISSDRFEFSYTSAQQPVSEEFLPSGKRTKSYDTGQQTWALRALGKQDEGSGKLVIRDFQFNSLDSKFYSIHLGATPSSEASIFIDALSLAYDFEKPFKSLFHIGPLRAEPERVYVASGETPEDVGRYGENTIPAMLVGENSLEEGRLLLPRVNRWMKEFRIASEVNLRQVAPGFFAVELTNPYTVTRINLVDTGFGASQVLPITVQGYYTPEDSLILLEQPEIHLHPHAQGTLADLLIDISKERKTLIVETHSEHLIGRVQTSVAEGSIPKDDVAIYYFQPTEQGTHVRELALNDLGQFESEGLPEDFLAQGYEESMRHMKAVASHVRGQPSAG